MRNHWPAALAIGALVSAPLGWTITDRLEADNAFCISCHLPGGTPLHAENEADFRAHPPESLAMAHAVAGNRAHEDGAFRCIDCHGGTGFAGRARVKLLSARDAFWYVTGRFEEPEGMHWPIRDEDCARCHPSFEEHANTETEGGAPDVGFHARAVHNTDLGVSCVSCHGSHERGALVDHSFLHPAPVRQQCARCHPEFEEEST